MAKIKSVYICSECGYESPKWYGKCPSCGEWNTMNEEIKDTAKTASASRSHATAYAPPVHIRGIDTTDEIRYQTGSKELDRVMGGGIVKGSLILLGGDPGIGKSTILLQICEYLGRDLKILYVSGEESKRQLKLRAKRLGVNSENLYILTQTDVELVCETIRQDKPDLVMIDSIQTMSLSELNSSPGSVTQVRESTNFFMRTAKSMDIPMIIVGHVNKEGSIAGPKVLEHVVDAVLHFEGDRQMSYRILRAVKNRYGSTNEIGVFEMRNEGLAEVKDPSGYLLSGRPKDAPGSVVVCAMEGTRPLLIEIQALVCRTAFGIPRRQATGCDYNRVNLLMAVLEKRMGLHLGDCDAYVNIAGGLKLSEPAADLGVVLAIVSSFKNRPISDKTVVFGEVGLSGEVRSVTMPQIRIREAEKLGFESCILPKSSLSLIHDRHEIKLVGIESVADALDAI